MTQDEFQPNPNQPPRRQSSCAGNADREIEPANDDKGKPAHQIRRRSQSNAWSPDAGHSSVVDLSELETAAVEQWHQ